MFEATRLSGLKIVGVRRLDSEEMDAMDWEGEPPVVLVLSNGAALIPQADAEGNSPGCLLFVGPKDEGMGVVVWPR